MTLETAASAHHTDVGSHQAVSTQITGILSNLKKKKKKIFLLMMNIVGT